MSADAAEQTRGTAFLLESQSSATVGQDESLTPGESLRHLKSRVCVDVRVCVSDVIPLLVPVLP